MIYDEWYYVNAARNIIGRSMYFGYEAERTPIIRDSDFVVVTRYHAVMTEEVYPNATRFTDPNTEHPPLAKLIVAFSALLLGENAIAYRLPSVLFGTLLLVFMYYAAKKIASEQVAFYSASFLSFETLTFVHSRIFMLDIFMVSLMVLGFYLFLLGQYFAAGAAIGLSTLSKEMGIIGVPLLITFFILQTMSRNMFRLKDLAKLAAKLALWFALPVALLSGAVAIWWKVGPYEQIQNIAALGGIKVDHYYLGDMRSMSDPNISPPWFWITNSNAIVYFERVIGANLVVKYVAAMNPMLIYLMLPAIVYSVWRYWNSRDQVALFALVWWAWSYAVFYPLAFAGRVMYIFYMLPTMGAISLMVASLMCDPAMNSYVRVTYLLCVIVGLVLQFPINPILS